MTWPIEVGVAWIDEGGEARGWSSLIRPDPAWTQNDWSAASQRVHNIPRSALDDAPPAHEVARDLLRRMEGRRAVSDAPGFDARWLRRLLITAGIRPAPPIVDFDAVAFSLFEGLELDRLYEKLEHIPRPHRAGPDSLRMARAIAHVLPGPAPELC